MDPPPSLEALPNELKLMVIHHLDERMDLKNLVHASPAFHAMYWASRRELYSIVLGNELETLLEIESAAFCDYIVSKTMQI